MLRTTLLESKQRIFTTQLNGRFSVQHHGNRQSKQNVRRLSGQKYFRGRRVLFGFARDSTADSRNELVARRGCQARRIRGSEAWNANNAVTRTGIYDVVKRVGELQSPGLQVFICAGVARGASPRGEAGLHNFYPRQKPRWTGNKRVHRLRTSSQDGWLWPVFPSREKIAATLYRPVFLQLGYAVYIIASFGKFRVDGR